jgi:FMN phosphatase YigB (HAD superfamily)
MTPVSTHSCLRAIPQVIVSQTVRSAKPAKAIYEVTLAKLREELGEDLQASEVRYFYYYIIDIIAINY